MKSIQSQADRMTALVEDLLDLAAIESGRRTPVIEPVSLEEVLAEVASSLRPLANRTRVELRINVASGLPNVSADRNELRQVFVNLLDNAIKFNRESGSVTVNAEKSGNDVKVSVADTGVGIPAQDLDRIFERFYRVDKARSREMGGTGLGLSIVKHILEAVGGSIRVESSVGKGSTFTVLLPIFKSN